jgi:hypothetical protein
MRTARRDARILRAYSEGRWRARVTRPSSAGRRSERATRRGLPARDDAPSSRAAIARPDTARLEVGRVRRARAPALQRRAAVGRMSVRGRGAVRDRGRFGVLERFGVEARRTANGCRVDAAAASSLCAIAHTHYSRRHVTSGRSSVASDRLRVLQRRGAFVIDGEPVPRRRTDSGRGVARRPERGRPRPPNRTDVGGRARRDRRAPDAVRNARDAARTAGRATTRPLRAPRSRVPTRRGSKSVEFGGRGRPRSNGAPQWDEGRFGVEERFGIEGGSASLSGSASRRGEPRTVAESTRPRRHRCAQLRTRTIPVGTSRRDGRPSHPIAFASSNAAGHS